MSRLLLYVDLHEKSNLQEKGISTEYYDITKELFNIAKGMSKESLFSPLIFHALKSFETHSHFLKRQRLLLPEWNDSYDTGFPGHLRYFHRTFDIAL